jgi:hypothetical protein
VRRGGRMLSLDGVLQGLEREAGASLRLKSGAAPATVSGEPAIQPCHWEPFGRLGRRIGVMTRKPGDLPSEPTLMDRAGCPGGSLTMIPPILIRGVPFSAAAFGRSGILPGLPAAAEPGRPTAD